MKLENLLQKPYWERRLPFPNNSREFTTQSGVNQPFVWDENPKKQNTQKIFLNELDPSSHKVFDVYYRSPRPKMKWDETKKENVKDGYEEVSRIAVAYQQTILTKKVTHTFGNPIWFGNEGAQEDSDEVAKVKTYWNVARMSDAFLQVGRAAFGTGDAAIYVYRDKNKIKWKVFSYEKGDIVTKTLRDGKEVGIRAFSYNGKRAVEIYGDRDIELWVYADDTTFPEEDTATLKQWVQKLFGKTPIGTKTEDKYVLVSKVSHGLTRCPFIYHREEDVCWGVGQHIIDKFEVLLSDLDENNRYYAYQMLFIKGGAISLPNAKWQGKTLASKSDSGDAKILAPADASNTFTLELEKLETALADITSTVFVRNKDLKGGDYSGAYLVNLYFPETQWAKQAYARMHDFIADVIDVFVNYVGIIEKDESKYLNLRMSYEFTPYVPRNITEEVNNINQSYAMGTLSRETAVEEHPMANPNEMLRLSLDDARKVNLAEAQKDQETVRQELVKKTVGLDNNAKNAPTEE